ncbi:MAG: hypothetical protein RIR00_1017 [Pseudomonadota bacterium]|jgi:PAS domain S-box-containing protein
MTAAEQDKETAALPLETTAQPLEAGHSTLLGPWGEAWASLGQEALIAVDNQFRILHWSANAEVLLGWAAGRALGFGLGSVLSLSSSVMNELRHTLALHKGVRDLLLLARRMGGGRCEFLLNASEVYDASRLPMGFVLTLRPLDQARKASQLLPQQFFERLLDDLPLPIVLADALGTIRFANAQARSLFGLEAEQPCCASLCLESLLGCRSRRVLSSLVPCYWEVSLHGQRVDMTAMPLALLADLADHVLYLGVPSQPHLSPELRKFFRAVDENLSGVLITDQAGRIEYANPRVSEILGYSPLELINRDLLGFIAGSHAGVLDPERPELSQGNREVDMLCKGGEHRAVRLAISDIRSEGGEVSNWVAILDDISARRSMEQREQLLREQVAHAARLAAVGEIATMIAHEISQPLTCIANFSQGLLQRQKRGKASPEALLDSLQEILSQVHRADGVIKNVRSLARRGAAQTQTQPVNALIAESLPAFRLLAQGSGVRVEFEAGEVLADVAMDRSQIEQVLINLVKNAIEASRELPGGGARVCLRTRAGERGRVRIEVEDPAPMPPAEILARLGEPFFTTKGEGLGLGLSISRTLLENHGTHLDVQPLPGSGKIFHFELSVSP